MTETTETCWWCRWGWPKQIHDIYQEAAKKLEDATALDSGPSHVVWGDENFDSAQWCLDHFDDCCIGAFTDEDLQVVRESLEKLLAVPDEFKCAQHNGGRPPKHWEMVGGHEA